MAVMAFIGCVAGVFDFPADQVVAFLDAANQFVRLALDKLQVIPSQSRQCLFHFALGDVPVSFGY